MIQILPQLFSGLLQVGLFAVTLSRCDWYSLVAKGTLTLAQRSSSLAIVS